MEAVGSDHQVVKQLLKKNPSLDYQALLSSLQVLHALMEKRRSDFRNLHQETSSGPKKSKKAKRGKNVTEQKVESSSPSENLVEEVMLLSHTVLEPYYDHIVN